MRTNPSPFAHLETRSTGWFIQIHTPQGRKLVYDQLTQRLEARVHESAPRILAGAPPTYLMNKHGLLVQMLAILAWHHVLDLGHFAHTQTSEERIYRYLPWPKRYVQPEELHLAVSALMEILELPAPPPPT